jgi:hypothetical protein
MLLLLSWIEWDFGGQTAEFVKGTIDLVVRFHALRAVQLDRGTSQPPIGPAGDRHDHFQIARQFGEGGQRRLALPLRFQKQLRLF